MTQLQSSLSRKNGFTLIEVAIVLLVASLVIGGVLVGKDMIRASEMRAQIRQIETYDTAAGAFRLKYKMLPGDLKAEDAQALGFAARSGEPGHGDGNGVLDGCVPLSNDPADFYSYAFVHYGCENTLFWRDLSQAQFIQEEFITAEDDYIVVNNNYPASLYFPKAKLPNAGGIIVQTCLPGGNHFVMAQLTGYVTPTQNTGAAPSTMRNGDIYAMDAKIDDGRPLEGNVRVVLPTIFSGLSLGGYWCQPRLLPSDCVTADESYNIAVDDRKTNIFGLPGTPTRCYPLIKSQGM